MGAGEQECQRNGCGGPDGAPAASLYLQGIVTSFILLSGRVDQIQQYAGFTLSLFAARAVSTITEVSSSPA